MSELTDRLVEAAAKAWHYDEMFHASTPAPSDEEIERCWNDDTVLDAETGLTDHDQYKRGARFALAVALPLLADAVEAAQCDLGASAADDAANRGMCDAAVLIREATP